MKLRIEKCIYGGAGLARADGKAVFVPFTLPGELVEARLVENKQSFANAELDAVLEPAAERASPHCPYFGECGGCHYQHAGYAQQLEIKRGILRETLERAHLNSLPEIVSVSANPLGYRNRIRLHIAQQPFALCYKRRASRHDLPVNQCPISAPLLEQALAAINRIGADLGLDHFTEIELFTNQAGDELLLSLWASRQVRDCAQVLNRFCSALQQDIPSLTGAAVFSSGVKHQSRKIAAWQAQWLTCRIAGHEYRVSIGSFFQVNRVLLDKLVELVCGGRAGQLAWDLYAGVGLFSAVLAKRFEQVIAVESAASSSQDLRSNLRGSKHKAVADHTLAFLRQQLRQKFTPPDLIVVDPPRTGLGKEIASLLTKVRAKTLVYVSCDPATLSRDLKALVESGYRFKNIHMLDMFPQTFHLESVTVLSLD